MDLFGREGKSRLLELGGGQGRDTFFFARAGFHVHVVDYAPSAVGAMAEKARQLALDCSGRIVRGLAPEGILSLGHSATTACSACPFSSRPAYKVTI